MAEFEYTDDLTIFDEDELWRRIHPTWWILDENIGRIRPTSQAFQDHPNGSPMSVFLEKVCSSPEQILTDHPGYSLASITAGLARDCGQRIVRRPLTRQPAHAEVFGRKSGKIRNRFAMESRWVVPPSD
jgi:hypothetical protein